MNTNSFKLVVVLCMSAFITLTAQPSFAADAPPQRETAAAEASRFDTDIDQAFRDIEEEIPEPVDILEEEVKEEKQPVKEGQAFLVKQIQIDGAQNISEIFLEPYLADLIDKEVTLAEVRDAVAEIKNYYRRRGYIAAYAFVPPQDVTDGSLRIQIIEGTLGQVEVQGNKWFSDKLIRRHIILKSGKTIKHKPLRKSLARLNKHPDLQTKAVLKPGIEELTSDLVVEVEEKMPVHLSVDANNFGTRLTGKVRGGTTLAFNNLTGNLDRLIGRAVASDGSVSGAVDYSVPIMPNWGTRLGGSYNYVNTDLEKDFKVLKAEGDSETYSVYIDQPAYESKHLDVSLRFGFDHRSIEQRILNAVSGKDDIRRFNIGVDFQEKDLYGKTFWIQTAHVGIDAFGASGKNDDNLTRANTGAPYFVYRTSIDRYLFLPHKFMLVLRGSGQVSGDKLSPSEQFQIGGANTVRGYPQGEFLGDIGATASAEAIIPILYFLPESWRLPYSDKPIRDQIKGIAFVDYGTAHLKAALAGEQKHKDIAGAGLGLRIQMMDRIYSRVAWARALTDDNASDGTDDFFYYSVGVELF